MHWLDYPFLRFVIVLALGITTGRFYPVFSGGLTLLLAASYLVLFPLSLRLRPLAWILLFLLGYGLSVRTGLTFEEHVYHPGLLVLEEEEYTPSEWKRYRARLVAIRSGRAWYPRDKPVLVYLKDTTSYVPGQKLVFNGDLRLPDVPLHPCAFDYRSHLMHSGIYGQVFLRRDQFILTGTTTGLSYRISAIRGRIREQIRKWLPEAVHQQIMLGILLGDKRGMDPDLKNTFATTGAMHVLAVSGLHVGLVFLLVNFLLRWLPAFRMFRWLQFLGIMIILLAYASLAGFTPSVIRAVVFLMLAMFCKLIQRPNPLKHILFLTAFLMLLADPYQLFLPSFQLSFLAVLGILVFLPVLTPFFTHRFLISDYLLKNIALSVAVQLTTLIITLPMFNMVSLSFWLSSILVVPGAFLLLILAIIMFATSALPVLHNWVCIVTEKVIDLLTLSLDLTARLPWSHIDNIHIPAYLVLPLPVLILLFYKAVSLKNKRLIYGGLFILPLWIYACMGHIHVINNREESALFIEKNDWAIGTIREGRGVLYVTGDAVKDEPWMRFTVVPWFTCRGIRKVNIVGIPSNNKSMHMVFWPKTDIFQSGNNNRRSRMLSILTEGSTDTLFVDLSKRGYYNLTAGK